MTNSQNLSNGTFSDCIRSVLGAAPDYIESNRLHRFSTNGKRGNSSGWCKLFADCRAGVFGCWRLGVSEVWSATAPGQMMRSERVALHQQVQAAKAERQRAQAEQWGRNARRIAFLWRQCREVTQGDPVHRYLCQRLAVIDLAVPPVLRLHPAMPYLHDGETVGTGPCMVAPIVAADGKPRALHRTYLTTDGRKADVSGPVKKLTPACGLLVGGSIRLHEPDSAGTLGVCEGIETALAAFCASGVPTVAAYCADALAGFHWLTGVRRLVIFADHDPAGQAAVDKLRTRAMSSGLAVTVMTPTTQGADWCDVWASRDAVTIESEAA